MKKVLSFLLLFSPLFVLSQLQYPETKKGDVVDDFNGTKVADPYRWLEDDNSDETKAWVKAQNKVTFDYLNAIPNRDKIKKKTGRTLELPKIFLSI